MNYYLYNSKECIKGEIKELINKLFDGADKYKSIGIAKNGYAIDVIINEGGTLRVSSDYKQSKIFTKEEVETLLGTFETQTGVCLN